MTEITRTELADVMYSKFRALPTDARNRISIMHMRRYIDAVCDELGMPPSEPITEDQVNEALARMYTGRGV